jgi:hypothetical protein
MARFVDRFVLCGLTDVALRVLARCYLCVELPQEPDHCRAHKKNGPEFNSLNETADRISDVTFILQTLYSTINLVFLMLYEYLGTATFSPTIKCNSNYELLCWVREQMVAGLNPLVTFCLLDTDIRLSTSKYSLRIKEKVWHLLKKTFS